MLITPGLYFVILSIVTIKDVEVRYFQHASFRFHHKREQNLLDRACRRIFISKSGRAFLSSRKTHGNDVSIHEIRPTSGSANLDISVLDDIGTVPGFLSILLAEAGFRMTTST